MGENLCHHVVLLDLDGTLVYPGGYRAAYTATLRELLARMNLDHLEPGDEVQEYFEALSVNSEWDMLPITIAIILEGIYQTFPEIPVSNDFETAIEEIRSLDTKNFQIDYVDRIRQLEPYFRRAETPSLGVLISSNEVLDSKPFPRLSGTALIKELLMHTRDINRSLIIRILQNYVLGNQLFLETYQISPKTMVDSYLCKYDRPLVSEQTCRVLTGLHESKAAHLAILTFRPSKPPKEITTQQRGYPPEAEIAVSLLDLSAIPMIGYGRLKYLAQEFNITTDMVIKPSPVQALAAIGAAWTGDEWQALIWAYKIFRETSNSHFGCKGITSLEGLVPPLPDYFHVHVFEDTPIGIISAKRATEVLEQCGYKIEFHAWGITQTDSKKKSLGLSRASIYPMFEAALQDFLYFIGSDTSNKRCER